MNKKIKDRRSARMITCFSHTKIISKIFLVQLFHGWKTNSFNHFFSLIGHHNQIIDTLLVTWNKGLTWQRKVAKMI